MRSARRLLQLVTALAVLALSGFSPSRALAHTELEFTLPADGTTVGEPIDEISVGFTEAVTLVGNGFRVLDPTTGLVIEPFVVTDDNMTFRLQLDPPLGGGQVGVEYEVASDDGHIVTGSFAFTVAAPAATTPPATSPATQPPTTGATPGTTPAPVATAAPTTAPLLIAPTPTSVPATSVAPEGDDDDDNSTIILAGAAVVAAAAIAFLVVRSRKAA